MIKFEPVTISGTVIYCDGCGVKGPYEAYDNRDDVMEAAEDKGWDLDDDSRQLCPKCQNDPKKAKKPAKGKK